MKKVVRSLLPSCCSKISSLPRVCNETCFHRERDFFPPCERARRALAVAPQTSPPRVPLIDMPVTLPGFFSSSSFSLKSPADPDAERREDGQGQATNKGKDRKGSMVTISASTMARTPRVPSAPGPVILMRGLLQKRTTGTVSARWVARTVVIEGAPSHMLCYYDAAEKGKPKNVLRLSELTSRRKENKDTHFLAITAARTYEFKAPSAGEAAEWVACITAAAGKASSAWQEQQQASRSSIPRPPPGPSPSAIGDSFPSPPSAPPSQPRRSVLGRGFSAMFMPRKSLSSKKVERIPAPENEGSSEWEDVLSSTTSNAGLAWDEAYADAEML